MDDDDDLDELLDEVEKKFCRSVCVASLSRGDSGEAAEDIRVHDGNGKPRSGNTKVEQSITSVTEDIDALLEELLEENDGSCSQGKTKQVNATSLVEKKVSSQSGGRKCCPVFVGGSSVTNGVGTATSKRSCDQLRCTSCDFRVLAFEDCEWDSSCDYLFFRNNMPDHQKLRAKLKNRRGSRAYACQCSWFCPSEPTDLRNQPQLRWVCGKHQDSC